MRNNDIKLSCMLLSSVVPEEPAVGGIILEGLCKLIPKEQLAAYLLLPERRTNDPQLKQQDQQRTKSYFCDSQIGNRDYEQILKSTSNRLGRYINIFKRKIASTVHKQRLIQDAVDFGKKNNIQAVWSILNSPISTEITLPIIKRLNVPLYVLVWDDPEYLANTMLLDRIAKNDFLRAFKKTMKVAKRAAVCGETMATEYTSKFGTESVVVRHAVDKKMWKPTGSSRDQNKEQFIIGYCGSVSAPEAMESFLSALDLVDWKIAGKDIVFRIMGASFHLKAHVPRRIEFAGWRSNESSIKLLHESDINYMPQPFLSRLKQLTQYSFPTKLNTYLAAGRPIFLHGPEQCSIGQFSQQFACTEWCKSKDLDAIIESLTRLATDQGLVDNIAREIDRARETEINTEVFQKRFAQFLS